MEIAIVLFVIAIIFIAQSVKVVPSSTPGSRSAWASTPARSRPA
jgi:hypothetical protein